MTQAKQAENSRALARQPVAKGWRHPDSGGHRFMAWLGRTAQQHGSPHPPSFFPATRTVSAKLTHPAFPAMGLAQLRALHSPLTLPAAAPSTQQGKQLPVGAPGQLRLVHPSS